MNQPLILASSSVYRRELLGRIVREFQTASPSVDEAMFHSSIHDPAQLASTLAREKASAVSGARPQAIVIGSDQVVDLDGLVLGKPGTADRAVQQLLQMSGKRHRLITAVCIIDSSGLSEFVNETWLSMRTLSWEEATRYVAVDQPLDCAGSYKIEAAGIGLFDRIECDDFTAIVGLPLLQLAKELRRRGIAIP